MDGNNEFPRPRGSDGTAWGSPRPQSCGSPRESGAWSDRAWSAGVDGLEAGVAEILVSEAESQGLFDHVGSLGPAQGEKHLFIYRTASSIQNCTLNQCHRLPHDIHARAISIHAISTLQVCRTYYARE